ncbi:MAG: septum formation initiator family protein [Deltaproteobacteria bacterium]|nr:septum formation initiator family protein [Deltaproteobacteria bacterium]
MAKKIKFNDKKVIQGLILFCSLIVITLSLIGDKGFFQHEKLQNQQAELLKDIKALKVEKSLWEQKVSSLKKDNQLYETLAREKLGLTRNDETLLKFEPVKVKED